MPLRNANQSIHIIMGMMGKIPLEKKYGHLRKQCLFFLAPHRSVGGTVFLHHMRILGLFSMHRTWKCSEPGTSDSLELASGISIQSSR